MKRIVLAATVVSAIFTALAGPPTAYADTKQPYGGCKEAVPNYLNSAGADECRELGWVLRPRLAINPHGVLVRSALPHCEYEDGSGQRSACLWDSGVDGINGIGLSYVERRGEFTNVWMSNPVRGHADRAWPTRYMDRMLDAEHGQKDWRRCVVQVGPTLSVRCPDGVKVTY